jgi:hypothetical protein
VLLFSQEEAEEEGAQWEEEVAEAVVEVQWGGVELVAGEALGAEGDFKVPLLDWFIKK